MRKEKENKKNIIDFKKRVNKDVEQEQPVEESPFKFPSKEVELKFFKLVQKYTVSNMQLLNFMDEDISEGPITVDDFYKRYFKLLEENTQVLFRTEEDAHVAGHILMSSELSKNISYVKVNTIVISDGVYYMLDFVKTDKMNIISVEEDPVLAQHMINLRLMVNLYEKYINGELIIDDNSTETNP